MSKENRQPVSRDGKIGISVRLFEDDYKKLKELSILNSRSISRHVEKLIKDHITASAIIKNEKE